MLEEEDIYHQNARLGHTEDLSAEQLTDLDVFYASLNASELELFMNASKDILLELCETQDETDEINNSATECAAYLEDLNDASMTAYSLPVNQLGTEQRIDVINGLRNKGSAGCIQINFPQQACFNSGWVSCGWYQKVSTPSEPWDCDYEFGFPANQNFTYGTTWFATQTIKWWGGGLAKRSGANFTGMLVGNGAINFFYWGSASNFKKRFKTKS